MVWTGQTYIMERMGFGLSIAPKVMDAIVKYAVRSFPDVNYVDDLKVPEAKVEEVARMLERYGLPTKPAEPLSESRVLGLQLYEVNGQVHWWRRDDCNVLQPDSMTKRGIFSWCGKLITLCAAGYVRPVSI